MKKAVLAILIMLSVITLLFINRAQYLEVTCRQNCDSIGAEFIKSSMGNNGVADRCVCKKNEDFRNIW